MSDECTKIHELTKILKKHSFPFGDSNIPPNGIYFLFQRDEIAHNQERIVRVGTHNGNNRLYLRLKEHFLKENKDRSIFRKNIGRCLLNKNNDPFLEFWEKDLTSKQARDKYLPVIDRDYQHKIELEVSTFIKDNFSFAVIEVQEKKDRLATEAKLISTISLCTECFPSNNWLGMYAPSRQHTITESGLWQTKHVFKTHSDSLDLELLLSANK